ncbi:MAG: Fe(2+)-trafficking protein [Planctomycetota bacterium]|nr:Fe(2+)-trafficking protein [Planctomycetota bacterium]
MTDGTTTDRDDARLEQRIAQFENMTAADPENEMAHFSLGNAYLQAGRAGEAARSFSRVTELNPDMSKAYQLAGEAMIEAGLEDASVAMLEAGWRIAATRGDLLVRDGIAERLRSIGREAPTLSEAESAEAEEIAASGSFLCRRTGRSGTQLESPPFKGPVGVWIHENISAETWRDWIGQGTKVINELRLDFSRDEDQETYDRHMREFLGIDDDLLAELQRD